MRIILDTDEDQELITILTNYVIGDTDAAVRVAAYYKFNDRVQTQLFMKHINIACELCHLQSFLLHLLIKDVISLLNKEQTENLINAIEASLETNLQDFASQKISRATFYAICVRNNLLDPSRCLDVIKRCLQNSVNYSSGTCESFIIQMLFFCGDLLNDAEPTKTKKIIKTLERRTYAVTPIAADNFDIARKLNDPTVPSFCDYVCFKNDDVDYLQKLAADPSFDKNRKYDLPVWEPDPILHLGTSLICAAAYYGAIKCFRYLFLTGASMRTEADPNEIGRRFFRPAQFGFGFGAKMDTWNEGSTDIQQWLVGGCPAGHFATIHNVISSITSQFAQCDVLEYAIAGNAIDIVTLIDQSGVPADAPLTIAAAYNRRQIYSWMKTRSTVHKEGEMSFVCNILATDNAIFVRHILRTGLVEIPSVMSTHRAQVLGIRCMCELAAHYRGTPQFDQIMLPCTYTLSNTYGSATEALVRMYINQSNPALSIGVEIGDREMTSMLLHKRASLIREQVYPQSTNFGTVLASAPLDIVEMVYSRNGFPEFLEKSGKNAVFQCIQLNNFEAVEFFIKRDDIRAKYSLRDLMEHTSSIEMREFLKKNYVPLQTS